MTTTGNRETRHRPLLTTTEHFSSASDVTLYCGDRLELLNEIETAGEKAALIVTSPPYNLGKEYEDSISMEEYLQEQERTIEACLRVLADTGSICWQVGHHIVGSGKLKEAVPLDIALYPIFKDLGLRLVNRIVWTFGHGLHENNRFSGRHETILWFTRYTDQYTFNLDPIRVPQKYPGKRAYRGPQKGKPSGNPLGKNPGDVWDDMPNVKSNHVEKTVHPCQFPVGLVERLVLSMTQDRDLVIDPYLGVGSTAVAAFRHGRRCAGSDLSSEYLSIAHQRLELEAKGLLKTRPLNKPLHEPGRGGKLTEIPEEWLDGNTTQ